MTPRMPRPSEMPAQMPHYTDSWARRLCRGVLRLAGWRLVGTLPDCPKLVLIGAPHSSWWDGIWGLMTKVAIGANVHFMAKQELFVGPLGWLLRKLGGLPIDRSAAKGVVEQMVERFGNQTQLWLGITPEGTRKPVQRWKSGFWHIAHHANVPVLAIYFHYPEHTIGVGPLFHTSEDTDADIARMRAFFTPFQGKHRGA